MSHLEEYIKEEKEGAKDYKKMALKAALEKKMFKKMSKDEASHAKKLKKLEMAEKD